MTQSLPNFSAGPFPVSSNPAALVGLPVAVDGRRLKGWLARLKNHNAAREYYLTDVIAMAVKDKVKVIPLAAPTVTEVLGVNDKLQLAAVEAEYRRQRARELMLAGVTVISSSGSSDSKAFRPAQPWSSGRARPLQETSR